MFERKVIPGVAAGGVVLADSPPSAFREIGAPAPPVLFAAFSLFESLAFGSHEPSV
jgi:hypothetical protein